MATLTEQVRISLPADLKARLQDFARQRGLSMSALLREITSDLIFRDYANLFQTQAKQRGIAD